MFCSKCDKEIMDEAIIFLRYSELPKNEAEKLHSNEKRILTAAKSFYDFRHNCYRFCHLWYCLIVYDTN